MSGRTRKTATQPSNPEKEKLMETQKITTTFAKTLNPYVETASIDEANFIIAQLTGVKSNASWMAPKLMLERKNKLGAMEIVDATGIAAVKAMWALEMGYSRPDAKLEFNLHLREEAPFSGQWGIGVVHSAHPSVQNLNLETGWYQINMTNGVPTYVRADPEREMKHTVLNALISKVTVLVFVGANGGRPYYRKLFLSTPEERTRALKGWEVQHDAEVSETRFQAAEVRGKPIGVPASLVVRVMINDVLQDVDLVNLEKNGVEFFVNDENGPVGSAPFKLTEYNFPIFSNLMQFEDTYLIPSIPLQFKQ